MRPPSLTIAQIVCTYPPYRGGMGQVAFEYTTRLRARGHRVHVFTNKHAVSVEDPEWIHRLPSVLHVGNAGVLPSLYRRLSGFDIVHLHYPFYGGAEPVIVRKAMRHDQGLVLTYHMDATAGGIKGALFSAHRRVLLPWIIGRSDRILASSDDYIRTSAIAEIDGALDRVEIHPFGIDLNRFHPGKEDGFKRKLTIRTDVPTLLFVGGLDSAHHFKGVPVLIEAIAQLAGKSFQLLIVGDGNLRPSFEATVRARGLNDRVHFLGNVADRDLPSVYRCADIHLFPSTRRAEAFGLVALEAAATGIPTIASNLPGVRTVVQDGNTGLLVPPEDVNELTRAITLLIEQPEIRARFGLAARAMAQQRFAWDPFMDRLEQTYRSVMDQQSARFYPV
ncbi:glycosyltransferase family 4 protein [Candidatus Uhrbacteria bacterium]|nr:glycosyltransferase family 4 protein [Candidatus Uhrbacteria bacterium]